MAVVSWPNDSTTAINNDAGMVTALAYVDSTNNNSLGVFYLNNAAAGTFTVNFTPTNYINNALLELYEVLPLAASPVLVTGQWINSGTVDPDVFDASLATQSVASVQFSAWGRGGTAYNNATASMPAPWTIDGSILDGATTYAYAAAASADVAANTAPTATWTITGSPTGAVEDFISVAFSLAASSTDPSSATVTVQPSAAATAQSSQTSASSASIVFGVAATAVALTAALATGTVAPTASAIAEAINPAQSAASISLGATSNLSTLQSATTAATVTLTAAVTANSTQAAQVLTHLQPGVAVTATQINAVTAQVLAFASPRTLASAFNNYAEAAALFAAIQAGVPRFYTGYKPQPAQAIYFLQSGSWTVPAGTYFYVSATAAGGSPLGVAGRQALGQSLPVVPGDVLTVTIGPNVLVQKGSTTLLSLLDGAPYAKNTGAGLPQDSKIVGLGSGVDSGPAYPACVVFFWR